MIKCTAASDVRAGHRGPGDRLEQLTSRAIVGRHRRHKRIGGHARQDLHAGGGDIGLADAQNLPGAAARAEGSHHVALGGDRCASWPGGRCTGVGCQERQQRLTLRELYLHSRQEVVVGFFVGHRCALVVQDHPSCAAYRDIVALLDTAVVASLADNDHPGHTTRGVGIEAKRVRCRHINRRRTTRGSQ